MIEKRTDLMCQCGATSLTVIGKPIISAECLCADCQRAGEILQKRKGAPTILDRNGATRLVLYRKDKVEFQRGSENLKSHYLEKDSSTRRVVARCCNTPIFLEFKGGHWLSIYGLLWSKDELPVLEIRTMTRSRREGVVLSDDVPNPKTQTISFFLKLFRAWVSMRFRTPKLDFVTGNLDD